VVRVEHTFPVIAAIVIPAFDLRAALRLHPRLQAKAAALAPLPGTEQLIGSVTAVAESKGVRAGDAAGRGARDVPGARAGGARPGHGRAGVGRDPAPARGRGVRGRAGGAGDGVLRVEGRRAALRRPRAGAQARARGSGDDVGRTCRRSRAAVRSARRSERRSCRAGADRQRRPRTLLPRTRCR